MNLNLLGKQKSSKINPIRICWVYVEFTILNFDLNSITNIQGEGPRITKIIIIARSAISKLQFMNIIQVDMNLRILLGPTTDDKWVGSAGFTGENTGCCIQKVFSNDDSIVCYNSTKGIFI